MSVEQIINKFSWHLLIAIGASIVVFTFLIANLTRRILIKRLEAIKDAVGGKIISTFFGNPYLRIKNYEAEMRIKITSGSRNSPPSLFVSWMSPLHFYLFITTENILTRTLQHWIKEVKVGESSIDDKYYIRSDNPEQTTFFLQYPRRREAMEYLFNNGFNYIRADKTGITTGKTFERSKDQNPERIQSYIKELRKFVLAQEI